MQKFDFSFAEYQRFIEQCPFTDEEVEILNLRRKGKSTVQIAFILKLSERTVQRRINSIKKKISKEM